MLAGDRTGRASHAQATGFGGIQGDFDPGFSHVQAKAITGQCYPLKKVDIIFATGGYQLLAPGTQQLTGLDIG